jgi:hypothetical protein
MAMSHAGHNHPATPAGRAACRKAGATEENRVDAVVKSRTKSKPAVKKADAEPVPERKVKGDTEQLWRVRLTGIPEGSSLLGMPAYVAELIKLAWRQEWRTEVGNVWHADGRRSVVVKSYRGDLVVRWTRGGNGITSVEWRSDVDGSEELGSMNEGIRKLKGE